MGKKIWLHLKRIDKFWKKIIINFLIDINMKKINIGIIGGGLSGLIVAKELYKNLGDNVNITIIEKEREIGGRIFSKKFNGCPIELGAQFFIDGEHVHHLIKTLNLRDDIISLKDKFISFRYNNKIFTIDEISSPDFLGKNGKTEKDKLLDYANNLEINKDLISQSFRKWYKKNINGNLISFWNRLLISIGVKDVDSINAYFGLILINVFFGSNYLLKDGLGKLVNNLLKELKTFNPNIITNSKCININKKYGKFLIEIDKKRGLLFDKIISAIKPEDLSEIFKRKNIILLDKIEGYPMALYVVESDKKLWDKTWGLIICEEKSPIYAICDWKNVTDAKADTPILIICSPFANKNEIISELGRLFIDLNPQFKIIYEKKWDVGLHQLNGEIIKIRKKINMEMPEGLYLAGDWMAIPALEGAVISGKKAAKSLIIKNCQ